MSTTNAGTRPGLSGIEGASAEALPSDRAREPAGIGWSVCLAVGVLAAAVVFLLAYHQPFGTSRDYGDYEDFLDTLQAEGLSGVSGIRYEPGFVLLAAAVSALLPSSVLAYAVLAGLAAGLKFFVFATFAERRHALLPVALFYFARYLPIHELTQLRASLAIAFVLLAFRLERIGRRRLALVVGLIAPTLHLSSSLVLPLLFLRIANRRALVVLGLALAAGVIAGFEVVFAWLTPTVTALSMYDLARALGEQFEAHDPLSLAILLEIVFVASMLAFWRYLSRTVREALTLQVLGLVLLFALWDWPMFGVRFHEMLGVFSMVVLVKGVTGPLPVRVTSYAMIALAVIGYGRIHFFSETEPLFH